MIKILFPTLILMIILLSSAKTQAQFMTVELATPYVSSHPTAIVVDPSDSPIPGVLVKRMNAGWKKEIESTKTNGDGRFRFKRYGSIPYYLEITCPGFQVMHVKLKIVRRKTKVPRIRIEIAT